MLNPSGAAEYAFTPPDDLVPDHFGAVKAAEGQIDPRRMVRELKAFNSSSFGRSIWELAITLVPFLVLMGAMFVGLDAGFYWVLALAPAAGLFLLRLFLIQHDCGHGAFFPTRSGNDWLGRALGVLTLTPYDCWKRSHALHHAGTGNLDARGFGDVDTLTVREFEALTPFRRALYRMYRHPVVLLGVGPAYQFLVRHRLPFELRKASREHWVSAMATNAATALILAALIYGFGIGPVAAVFLPVLLIAASIGVWLFYIQHQFEDSHWDEGQNWSFHDAALHGSSHLVLPPVMRWFSANIGVHHVHHIASRIPFYRLPEVLRAFPELEAVNRFTPRQTLGTLWLALWDEDQRRLVRFA